MEKLNMRPNTTRGYLITFCGLDGCGKTTMINLLEKELKGRYDLYITKQPTDFVRKSDIFRTYMDQPIHDAYDYRSLSLLAASDRLQHVNKVIEDELRKGKVVLCDRYFYSCLANLRARGFKNDKWIYEIAESVIEPDVAFFLETPVDIAVNRVRNRIEEKDRYIDMDLQYRLQNEYLDICDLNKGVLVPTNLPIEESYQIIKKAVERIVDNECNRRSN